VLFSFRLGAFLLEEIKMDFANCVADDAHTLLYKKQFMICIRDQEKDAFIETIRDKIIKSKVF
jgi:hypothetical protein